MAVLVHIPTPLRPYTDKQSTVRVEGATVAQALAALTDRYPGLARHLRDERGALRSFVNVYVGSDDIRSLQHGETPLGEGAELTIVPAIAGGAA